MAEIKTIYKGESVTLLFTFPALYDMSRLTSHKVFVGETEFTGVIEGQAIRMQLKSSDTNRMIGTHRIVCFIDDTTLGLRKPYCGELIVAKTQASGSTTSVSNISDIIIPIVISETAITVGDILYNYVKGDPFTYSDFTPEQLEALKVKGDAFEYSDFTPEQIALLQKPASDIATTVSNAEGLRVAAETNRNNAEGLRLSAEITRNENEADRIEAEGLRAGAETSRQTAEGLRVQAELNRQTNTSTAIQNAETATTNAGNAASLANEKAGLANEVANHPDKVVADYWHKWNITTKAYENTGIKAKGDAGAVAVVKQTTGTSETDVMSQKAVSDELFLKQLKTDTVNQKLYTTIAATVGDVADVYLTQTPTGSLSSNARNTVRRYSVTAGEKIYLVGSTYCESPFAVYGFSASPSITGAIIQLGTTATGMITMDAEITVPAGASYMMVTLQDYCSLILARKNYLKVITTNETDVTALKNQVTPISEKVELMRTSQIGNIPLPKKQVTDTLKILYVGSSWMQDNAALVRNTALASGLNVKVGNWYKGSCSYQDILTDWDVSIEELTLFNINGTNTKIKNCSVKSAVINDRWDIVVLANSASNSFDWSTYGQYFKDVLRLVKMYAPQATLATYQGWVLQYAMAQAKWDISLEVLKKSVIQSGINVVIPTGMALWSMLSTSYGSDTNIMYRGDQTHLSYGFGRYIAACTNFVALITPVFGVTVLGNPYRCADLGAGEYTITEQQALDCQLFALSANGNRFEFIDM